MPVLFRVDHYVVGLTFWRRRTYVRDLATGKTVHPGHDAIVAFQRATEAMHAASMSGPERDFVANYIAFRFAESAMNPSGFTAEMFLNSPPKRLVDAALLAAQAQRDPSLRRHFQ